jgi:VanZ family protein
LRRPDVVFPRGAFSAARLVFLAACVALLVATLAPFTFAWNEALTGARWREAAAFPQGTPLIDLAVHVSAFAALAILGCTAHGDTGSGRPLSAIICGGCALCLALEAVQFFNPLRHARIIDLVTHASGLSAGFWFSLRTRRGAALTAHLARWTDRQRVWIPLVLLLAVSGAWVSFSYTALRRATTLGWDPSFPLLIGNEKDSSRPWSGTLGYIRLHESALSAADVSHAHARRESRGDPASAFSSPRLSYDFRGSRSAAGLALESIAAASPEGPHSAGEAGVSDSGIALVGSAPLSPPSPPVGFVKNVAEKAAFSIEAWFKPADLAQGGPARIVSISDSPRHRNLMLGQDGSALVFRVRNGVNGLNGSAHALEIPDGVSLEWQHVVAVYDQGVSRFYKNGQPLLPRVDVRDPSLSFPLARPESAWFVLSALGALGVTLPAFALLRRLSLYLRHAAAIASGVGVLLGPVGVTAWHSGVPLHLPALPWIVALLALCHAAAAAYCRKASAPSPSWFLPAPSLPCVA